MSRAAYHRLKATREREKENVLHLYMFSCRRNIHLKQNAKTRQLNVHQNKEGKKVEKIRNGGDKYGNKIFKRNFQQELTLLKKLKVTIMMCQWKRAPVHVVNTDMNMKKELMKLLEMKK